MSRGRLSLSLKYDVLCWNLLWLTESICMSLTCVSAVWGSEMPHSTFPILNTILLLCMTTQSLCDCPFSDWWEAQLSAPPRHFTEALLFSYSEADREAFSDMARCRLWAVCMCDVRACGSGISACLSLLLLVTSGNSSSEINLMYSTNSMMIYSPVFWWRLMWQAGHSLYSVLDYEHHEVYVCLCLWACTHWLVKHMRRQQYVYKWREATLSCPSRLWPQSY